jgi:hypothetical protein
MDQATWAFMREREWPLWVHQRKCSERSNDFRCASLSGHDRADLARPLGAKIETHALHQTAALFDQLVGSSDQRILNARREIKRETIAERRRLHFAKAA